MFVLPQFITRILILRYTTFHFRHIGGAQTISRFKFNTVYFVGVKRSACVTLSMYRNWSVNSINLRVSQFELTVENI